LRNADCRLQIEKPAIRRKAFENDVLLVMVEFREFDCGMRVDTAGFRHSVFGIRGMGIAHGAEGMVHGAWCMGHGAEGMAQRAWGIGQGADGMAL